jgi:phosphoribosylformylglycinamidine synthase II
MRGQAQKVDGSNARNDEKTASRSQPSAAAKLCNQFGSVNVPLSMAFSEPTVTPEIVAQHGLTPEEFERIKKILGREPNFTELGIFSVMWSEHCSYKNSRKELKKFPTTGPNILVKAGEENAGVVDIGDGWAVAFKIESHNHPSAIEPFQGAATGVGGIIRDIFTMGARPEFLLNSLRFGPITECRGGRVGRRAGSDEAPPNDGEGTSSHPADLAGDTPASTPRRIAQNRRLFAGVIAGIAHYGNCVGVPTIGGEIYFDESFEGNPLVNVFCLGVLRHEQLARGAASGVGNPVFYVGAETGRDGLAGAAFASRELTEESKEDRPAVQVGDPFKEKLLLEACLELLATDAVAGIQDMGAAGLTCSTCETASRGGTGVEIDLAKVPKRESGMTPYETLLSESQERMLIIARRGKEDVVRRIFEKWDVPCAEIGRVTDDGMMRVLNNGSTAAEIPAKPLADEAPLYEREARKSTANYADYSDEDLLKEISAPSALQRTRSDGQAFQSAVESLRLLLRDPSIASKNWVYRQYDHMVRTGTVVRPGSDAAVFHLRAANKFLAATTDCNSLYCRLDPRAGGRIAVAEAARNLACSGALPLAVTDNLNFGNPYKPENFWQLREAVEGLAEACHAFATPVVGGNVSLYNESPAGVVDPTPTVAMVGLIEREEWITTQFFKTAGDVVILLGDFGDEMGGSQFLKVIHGRKAGRPPRLDFERELAVQNALREMIRAGYIRSAHDCSEGGLAVALAESCFNPAGSLGAILAVPAAGTRRLDQIIFNETQSRIVISTVPENADAVLQFSQSRGVPAHRLGTIGGEHLEIAVAGETLRWPMHEIHDDWFNAIASAVSAELTT